jgi:hypothetical protein
MRYDETADRLIGGDFFREVSGKWTLSVILSIRRGTLLHTTVGELAAAYRAVHGVEHGEEPFAIPLALIQLAEFPITVNGQPRVLSVEEMFNRPELAMAPPEYRQLGQLVTIVPSTETLAAALPSGPAIDSCVRQLFLTLACGHTAGRLSFSNARGSCVAPSAVTTAGAFLDLYWITRASEAYKALAKFQHQDLGSALAMVMWLADRCGRPADELLTTAAESYTGSRTLHDRCGEAARKVAASGTLDPLSELAERFRTGVRT